MTLWPEDSASDYLKGMMAYADKLMAQSQQLDAALATTAVTVQRQELELTAHDVVIEKLTFTRDVSGASPIALREKVLSAYREAQSLSLNQQGNAVARTTGSPAIVAETQQQALDAGELSGKDNLRYEATDPVETEIVVTRADIDAMPDPLEEGPEIESLAELVRELGWSEETRTPGDPYFWQRDLERELDAQAARMSELRPQLEAAEAVVKEGAVTVTVGARGDLRDIRFESLGSRTLDELNSDFRKAYGEAANSAADAVEELIGESGFSTEDEDDDLPDPFAATYRRVPRVRRRER